MAEEIRKWLGAYSFQICEEFARQVNFTMNKESKLPCNKNLIHELEAKRDSIVNNLVRRF